MNAVELCEELAASPKQWAVGCPAAHLWSRCPSHDLAWLVRLARVLDLCERQTFVRLAYDFASRVLDPDDSHAGAALARIERCFDGNSMRLDEAQEWLAWKPSTSAAKAASSALWVACMAQRGAPLAQIEIYVIDAAELAVDAAGSAARARALQQDSYGTKRDKSWTAWGIEREWQCKHVRKLIPAPDLPGDLERAVAAKRLRDAV